MTELAESGAAGAGDVGDDHVIDDGLAMPRWHQRLRTPRVLLRVALIVVLGGLLVASTIGRSSPKRQRPTAAVADAVEPANPAPATPAIPVTQAAPLVTPTTEPPPIAALATPLPGCPPPPPKGGGGGGGPAHPSRLVPDAALPAALPPAARTAPLDSIAGKGMWTWKWSLTEGGDAAAVIKRAEQAGLHQIWVRVGDSFDGFYGASVLDAVVPLAHTHHIAIIAWGFPYLYDPVGDAAWTNDILNWRGPDGVGVDAFSPDVETASEGTALSARRATVYLSLIREAAERRPIVATVFPPTDQQLAVYPFQAMAPYVDAFAPMVYWGCREPGDAASNAVAKLSPLAPVHLIGQAYDMAPEGGRVGAPSAQEIQRFCDVARRSGARGCSFWSWQAANDEEWNALAGFTWPQPQ